MKTNRETFWHPNLYCMIGKMSQFNIVKRNSSRIRDEKFVETIWNLCAIARTIKIHFTSHLNKLLWQLNLFSFRIRRYVSQYPWNRNSLLGNVNSPYALKRTFDNDNRLGSFYEGLQNQQDDDVLGLWNDNDNYDKTDEGAWLNSFTRPHYEFLGSRVPISLQNILRDIKPVQSSEQGYDYKNFKF